MTALAVYTTIYPGVEPYLPDWSRSLQAQTDKDFDLWIGLDQLTVEEAKRAMGYNPSATWVEAVAGDTPAQVRQRALAQIASTCEAVVLVDSDDTLRPSRVATAREMLGTASLVGCALSLVDQRGNDLGLTFTLEDGAKPEDVFPRNNIFGLSNSAFDCGLLRRCLPLPASAVLIDWYLATRAWLFGASMAFTERVQMHYRQHDANTARVAAPFTPEQVRRDTQLVRHHFALMKGISREGCMPNRLSLLDEVTADIEAFYRQIAAKPRVLKHYVEALNALQTAPLWWSCVAHPALQHMWTSEKEEA